MAGVRAGTWGGARTGGTGWCQQPARFKYQAANSFDAGFYR